MGFLLQQKADKQNAAEPIDFVIPWVDGNDPEWRARKSKCLGISSSDDREIRYRDWNLLRYWFRGVEKFTPWVRKIFFICDQEPPKWLNKEHSKLSIVRHEDYLPEEYRPAFSANPIELNIHRIEELSEQFVYFNDDTYLLQPLEKSFFFKKGLPCDSAVMNPVPTDVIKKNGFGTKLFTYYLTSAEYLNRDYDFHTAVRKNIFKWLNLCYGADIIRNGLLLAWPRFVGFAEDHMPNAYLKSSFTKAWEQDNDILDHTSRHHIRDDYDVNQWFIRVRQLAEGSFIPRKRLKNCNFEIHEDREEMHRMIREQLRPMICLNDTTALDETEFIQLQKRLVTDFEIILGQRSDFEKDC